MRLLFSQRLLFIILINFTQNVEKSFVG